MPHNFSVPEVSHSVSQVIVRKTSPKMMLYKLVFLVLVLATLGAECADEPSSARDVSILQKMNKCTFSGTLPDFWSGLDEENLDYTDVINIRLSDEEAKKAFAAREGIPSDDIFWGRLHYGEENFVIINATAFVIYDEKDTIYVRNFHYDPVNDCVALQWLINTEDMAEGELLMSDIVGILTRDDDGNNIELFGSFNCRLNTDNANHQKMCDNFANMYSSFDIAQAECIFENYKDPSKCL